MMRLPTFTDPNPSIEWLRNEQSRLRSQADKMLTATKIMDVFAKHGQPSPIEGSYLYELMMYPDLDIGLTADTVTKQDFADLLQDLGAHAAVRGISTADTINFNLSKRPMPKGYWIGVDIPFEGDRWGIDCWFQQSDWGTDQIDDYADRLISLDQSAKDAVLAIKYELIRNGTYGKQYLSNDVYDAVLDHGVRTQEEFENLV
ncbi:MAG TPA: hypothetical protein VG992_01725 [Candidatus Saccharimonadales bacterium]|nr:hypothetical protein [Candidatus Saccharimonadales bacterium]